MESELKDISPKEIKQLIRDVALIKNILLEEGELSNWAKRELEIARKNPEKIPHAEVKKRILIK